MKRVILLVGLLVAVAYTQTQQVAQDQAPGTQISREEIEKVLDTPDFKQLAQMMGIPVEKMTPTEKQALVDDTLAFGQQMEQLPPQEQDKIMQDIFSQITEQPPQEQDKTEPAIPEVKEEKQKEKAPEKEKISSQKVVSGKKAVAKLAKQLEKTELKFDSLLTASPESTLEQDWAQIKSDLPWTLSALHRISTSNKVLELLVSSEFSVLNDQIKDLYKQLKPLNKKFKTPDTAKLRQVTGTDASRAHVVNKKEKEESKQAATQIIKLLSGQQPAIHFGIKGMLEKYDKQMLEELEKLAKTKKALPLEKPAYKTSDYGTGDYPRSSGDYYTPSSGDYYQSPSHTPDYNYSPESKHVGSGSSKSGDQSGSYYGDPKKADDTVKDTRVPKENTKENGEEPKEDKEKKYIDKSAKLYSECNETIKALEENAEKFLKKHQATLSDLDKASIDAINSAKLDIPEICPALTELKGKLKRLINSAKKAESKVEEEFAKRLDEKTNLKNFAKLAQGVKTKELATSKTKEQKELLQKNLGECAKDYQEIIFMVKPTLQSTKEEVQKLAKELSEKESKEKLEQFEKALKELHKKTELLTKEFITETLTKEVKDKLKKLKTSATLKETTEKIEKQITELEKVAA